VACQSGAAFWRCFRCWHRRLSADATRALKAAQPVARCWVGELSIAGWQHADAGSTVRHHCNRSVHMHMMYLFCNVFLRFATGSRSPQFNCRCVI